MCTNGCLTMLENIYTAQICYCSLRVPNTKVEILFLCLQQDCVGETIVSPATAFPFKQTFEFLK